MKYKKIVIIIIIFLISIFCFIFIRSHLSPRYNECKDNYYSLIRLTIDEINMEVQELSVQDNLYDTIISLTEIKQNCMVVFNLTFFLGDRSSSELAIGDLLGYTYNYIDDIETEEINEELLVKVINELDEINTIFIRVNSEEYDEYFNLLAEELNKNIERYPENEILKIYSERITYEDE